MMTTANRSPRRRLTGLALTLVSAGMLVGCGGARAAAEAPASSQPTDTVASEPAGSIGQDPVDPLEAELAKSEALLSTYLGESAEQEHQKVEQAGAAASAAERSPAESKPQPTTAPRSEPKPKSKSVPKDDSRTLCESACKALDSMRRSAERICVLTSEDSERCTRAVERVSVAEERVARSPCRCPEEP